MAGRRYETLLKLASGGMATVWIGTVRGALGFRQLVAIKKPHPHMLSDPNFRGELVAEARLASMIRHANVVDVRDVEIEGDEISLVMDFIEGASVGDLLVASSKVGSLVPARVAVRIVRDACAGLHAAHELVDERDRPVGLVHRDVSPQNILVGTDGIARVTDFGVAKFARKHMQSTSNGSLKGKLAYMAPEYVRGEAIDRRFDVFGLGVVLWETLLGRRLFRGENEAETLLRVLEHAPPALSSVNPELAPLDELVACALAKNRTERFQNAAAMGAALEAAATEAGLMGSHTEVAATVKELVGAALDERRALVRAKLAHEPSVASLMGLPPLTPRTEEAPNGTAPSTEDDGPVPRTVADQPNVTAAPGTKAASTPKMGGGGGAPTAATLPLASAVPSTQPMTPKLAVLAPVGTTLPSGPPMQAPLVVMSTAPTLLATEQPLTPHTLRSSDEGGRAPSSRPSVGQTEHALAASSFPLPEPPRRSLVPFVVGSLVVAAGLGALVFVAQTRGKTTPTATVETASVTSASASAPPIASPTPPTSAAPSVLAPTASTSARPRTTARPQPKPQVPAVPPTPQPTGKQPPPNPYQ